MERHSEKRRRPKYPLRQLILPIAKDDADNVRNSYWKYRQTDESDPGNNRNERRRSNPVIDCNKLHCSVDLPKTSRNHGMPSSSRIKYVVPKIQDEYEDGRVQGGGRSLRNELLQSYVNSGKFAKNIAVVRRNRYVDDFNETDEFENSRFNENANATDETSEEVVDDHRKADYDEKDYEEQHEADDEIDDESDVLERQNDRMRSIRKTRETLSRGEKISSAPLLPRRHRAGKIPKGKISERCYSSGVDRRAGEIQAEEEETKEPESPECSECPPQGWSWRSRQREEKICTPGRKLIERYSDLPERSLLTDNRQARRPRSVRPEAKKSVKSGQRFEPICTSKCDRCGSTSAPKTTSSRNATCRLQDSRYFIDEANGEDYFEGSSRGSVSYQTKQRGSKEAHSPIYESTRKETTVDEDEKDEAGRMHKPCRNKNSRETTDPRRAFRTVDRRDEKSHSKNNKHYWGER